MKWSDEGIILSSLKNGETSLIVRLFSKNNGLYSGFIRGALRNKKKKGTYEVGNLVHAEWSSRIEENLGSFKIELDESFWSYAINSYVKLLALNSAISLIRDNLQERQPEQELYDALKTFLTELKHEADTKVFLTKYIDFELSFLKSMGYGLALSECGVTKTNEDLVYVSPKTGRAISEEVGRPYKDKLLKLPEFLAKGIGLGGERETTNEEIIDGLTLTGHFLNKHFYIDNNKKGNVVREGFVEHVRSQ